MPVSDPPHLPFHEIFLAWHIRRPQKIRLVADEVVLEVKQVRQLVQHHVVAICGIGPVGINGINRKNHRPLRMGHSIKIAAVPGEIIIIKPIRIEERSMTARHFPVGVTVKENRGAGGHRGTAFIRHVDIPDAFEIPFVEHERDIPLKALATFPGQSAIERKM